MNPNDAFDNPTGSATAGSVRGPMHLNSFQLLMRDWTHLGPYNAGQALCVSGQPDTPRWEAAVQTVVAQVGLGRPTIRGNAAFFSPADPIRIEIVTDTDMAGLAVRQMNLPFAENEFPIRFFILPEQDRHWLLAFYNHWIGDSFALRCLMRDVFIRYSCPTAPPTQLRVDSVDFTRLYKPYLGRFPLLKRIRMSSANSLRHLQAHRLNIPDPLDFHSAVCVRQLPQGLVEALRRRSHQLQCTVNDLFLAALAQTCGRLTAVERYRPRRRHNRTKIALGNIVDIRNRSSQPLDDVFGLYLSCCTMVVSHPEKRDLHELARSIGNHSRWMKQTNQAVNRFGTLKTAHIWYQLLGDPLHQAGFFQKASPTIAGISNVNLTGNWMDQPASANSTIPHVLDYLRISPTGPLLPMVFTLTTIGTRLSLCVTYRTTALNQSTMDGVITDFCQGLAAVAQ